MQTFRSIRYFIVLSSIIDDALISASPTTSNDASSRRELPDEHDNFEDLRVNNKIFVDKSAYIAKLLKQNHRFLRICRPRRFGKSNFLQMLNAFFKGNKTLFRDLAIHPQHDWQPRPVIYLDFNAMEVRTVEDFKVDLARAIRQIGLSYGHQLNETESIMTLLDELIYELSDRGRNFESVVVLVDEYDWPVRRNAEIENKVEVWECSAFMREFFREVKKFGDKIRLLLMTCTTPLGLRDFKGGLDYLNDITYDPEYSEMIGMTEEELTRNFEPHINAMIVDRANETFESAVREMRARYNGYCFSKNTHSARRLYNFHSVMSSLRNKNVKASSWHATGDPQLNMISIYQNDEYRKHVGTLHALTNYTITRGALQSSVSFNNPIPMVVFMVLYGYLTFRGYNPTTDEFTLDFPNEQVREKFIKEVLEPVPAGKLSTNDVLDTCKTLKEAMFDKKHELFIERLNRMAFVADKNVENQQQQPDAEDPVEADTKHEYVERIVRVFQICDINTRHGYALFRADFSLAGTLDLVADVPDYGMYVSEFECNKTVDLAMKRLLTHAKSRAFQKAFDHKGKICLTAMNFGEEGGAIDEWIKVTYDRGIFTNLQASTAEYQKAFAPITKLAKTSLGNLV